jgi:contact-dependent growth inhibition (CDI) system restriction endonuclease-like protein
LPPGFPVIDNFTDGIATSIKSIDLRAATYQDAARLTHRLEKYVNSVSDFVGRTWANNEVRFSDIQGRALQLIVPKGSLTAIQRDAIEAVGEWARSKNNNPVKIIITEF